jgi:hypothetical protein
MSVCPSSNDTAQTMRPIPFKLFTLNDKCNRNNSASTVTRLWTGWPANLGSFPLRAKYVYILCKSRPLWWSPSLHWVPSAHSLEVKRPVMTLVTHLHLVSRLRMRGAIPTPHTSSGRVNGCRTSPAQSILVSSPVRNHEPHFCSFQYLFVVLKGAYSSTRGGVWLLLVIPLLLGGNPLSSCCSTTDY